MAQSLPSHWHYVWLLWSVAFLVPWATLFLLFPRHRRAMWWASVFTAPFGLTEPFFVPEYWNPPSLFDLAQTTGFDIESLIFSFGIGGVGATLYNIATGTLPTPLATIESRNHRHRYHRLALFTPVAAFPVLLSLSWNPIYPAILSMAFGVLATIACRPDLKVKTLIGAALFGCYYFVFMLGLALGVPGYITQVWNLGALSGVVFVEIPAEEVLFGFSFGAYWAGIYEHLTWKRPRDN